MGTLDATDALLDRLHNGELTTRDRDALHQLVRAVQHAAAGEPDPAWSDTHALGWLQGTWQPVIGWFTDLTGGAR